MKRIVSIGDVVQNKNPDNEIVEEVPIFTVELLNRLSSVNPNKDIELQFELGPIDYEKIYKKDLSFGSMEEMQVIRDLLAYISDLDDNDTKYDILNSPFTNSIVLAMANTVRVSEVDIDTTKLVSFTFPDLNSYTNAVNIMKWIVEQERYF